MAIKDFLGTTTLAVMYGIDDDERGPTVKSAFFQPYKSPLNVLGRTTSIVTDPLLLGTGSAVLALLAGWELLKAFKNLVTLNTYEAKKNFAESGEGFLASGALLIAAILSPLINLIDLIAGAVTSLLKPKQINEEQHSEALSM